MEPQADFEAGIRVLVVHDSGLIREGLCRLLERLTGIEVVASVSGPQRLLEMAQQLCVDVALIDAELPGNSGFEATRRLRASGIPTSVVLLSVSSKVGDVRRALEAGASGFLLQDAGTTELEIALKAAATGKTFVCPTIIRQLAESLSLEDASKAMSSDAGTAQNYPQVVMSYLDAHQVDDILEKALHRSILKQNL